MADTMFSTSPTQGTSVREPVSTGETANTPLSVEPQTPIPQPVTSVESSIAPSQRESPLRLGLSTSTQAPPGPSRNQVRVEPPLELFHVTSLLEASGTGQQNTTTSVPRSLDGRLGGRKISFGMFRSWRRSADDTHVDAIPIEEDRHGKFEGNLINNSPNLGYLDGEKNKLYSASLNESSIEAEKKRRWAAVRSLATLLGFRSKDKGKATGPLIATNKNSPDITNVAEAAVDTLSSEAPDPRSDGEIVEAVASESAPIVTPHPQAQAFSPQSQAPQEIPNQKALNEPMEPTAAIEQGANSELPLVILNDGNGPISRQMPANEVVACLLEHGCKNLSENIDLSTFKEYPVANGGWSDIYCGRLTDGRSVAVKALPRELHTWSKCVHPNVLPLYGLGTFRDRIGMISPWMSKGTLPQFMKANPRANRRDFCVQVCEGLTYLHKTGIIHGDLKGANVLISDDNVATLADFGSSTLKDQSLKFTQAASGKALTIRWSAPELVTGSPHTQASDVYALGMTMYEILTGQFPYHDIPDIAVITCILRQILPKQPICVPAGHESGEKLWSLFIACWKFAPGERPSAATMKPIPLEGVDYQIAGQPDPEYEPKADGTQKSDSPK